MRTSYRLLSERSGVRLSPGARSQEAVYTHGDTGSVAKSSAKRFGKCLAHNLLAVLVLAAVGMGSLANASGESFARPEVGDSARGLVESHGCTNPSDPTHVVVTVDGVTRYSGQRMTDRAIEQAVFGVDHGLTVHAFCS